MEIERKFLVNEKIIPEIIKGAKLEEIEQAYIQVGETEKRIRKNNQDYFFTVKKGDGLSREEKTTTMAQNEYDYFMNKLVIGNVILKNRYKINLKNELIAELDIFEGDLKGLLIVEVEFESEEHAKNFVPPQWFGKEVTNSHEFKNQSLAMEGNPLNSKQLKSQSIEIA